MQRPYILHKKQGMYRRDSQIYLSLDFSGMRAAKILTFSALLDQKPGSFFDKKRLRALFVNAFIFNQPALDIVIKTYNVIYVLLFEVSNSLCKNI